MSEAKRISKGFVRGYFFDKSVLVTGASLGLSYFVIEPLIERRFNRLGHVLASRGRPSKAIATAA